MQHKAPFITQESPLIDRYIKIVKPPHRGGGRYGVIRDAFWKEEELWLVVQLTSGLQVAVAYTETDLPSEPPPPPRTIPQIGPAALLEMAQYWQSMPARHRSQPAPKSTKKTR